MAQLGGESGKMWEELRLRAVVEYIQGTWQCLLEHQTNQRFYYDSSTGAHQWEPPSLAGEWQAATQDRVPIVPSPKESQGPVTHAKQREVWHEVRTPKGKNLYFFEATSGRSEWTLPSGVTPIREHGHLPPSNPTTVSAGAAGGAGAAVEPQAAKMWQVLRSRSKQVRHVGDWSEFLDEASNEVFYYNSADGGCQWECPPELKVGAPGGVVPGGGAAEYSISL